MRRKAKNFGRFYVLARQRPEIDKESMVLQFTDGRTTHLREMYQDEYDEMCDTIEHGPDRAQRSSEADRLRRLRSSVLLRIGRLGINTIDNWDGIDAFCRSPKIAGKEFRKLSADELETLRRKLESIIRKGGLKSQGASQGMTAANDTEQAGDIKPFVMHVPVKNKSKYLS